MLDMMAIVNSNYEDNVENGEPGGFVTDHKPWFVLCEQLVKGGYMEASDVPYNPGMKSYSLTSLGLKKHIESGYRYTTVQKKVGE